jgi:hypothetical protein
MHDSEKSMTVPGNYNVVFECCVLALEDTKVHIESANSSQGIVAGRTSGQRVEVRIEPSMNQCVVTAKSYYHAVVGSITDWGRNERSVDGFFNALMIHIAPLASNPPAAASILSPKGSLPSSNYSSAPMSTKLNERTGWQVFNLAAGCLLLLVLLIIFLSILSVAMSHANP